MHLNDILISLNSYMFPYYKKTITLILTRIQSARYDMYLSFEHIEQVRYLLLRFNQKYQFFNPANPIKQKPINGSFQNFTRFLHNTYLRSFLISAQSVQ